LRTYADYGSAPKQKRLRLGQEQTHKSIRKNLIEETYEVIEAIDKDDYTLMREDWRPALAVVFHSQMAKEEKGLTSHVIDELCKK
jgi:tetrapyrrole methylase family protein/MazG family protein